MARDRHGGDAAAGGNGGAAGGPFLARFEPKVVKMAPSGERPED